MDTSQTVRGVCAALATVAYVARLAYIGNGGIDFFGYHANSLVVVLIVLVVLALPETIDRLPVGPTRD